MTKSGDLSGFSMMDLFRMEAETQVAILTDGLLALERDTGARKQVEPLMRAAHSIKGAARIVQLDAGVKVAHALEDCFVAAQEGKTTIQADHIDVLLRGVDMLGRMARIPEAELSGWQAAQQAEISELVAALVSVKGGKTEPVTVQQPQLPAASPPPAVPSRPAAVPARPPAQSSRDLGTLSMVELFRMEVENQAAILTNGLLELERAPEDQERVEPLMRAAHSIKGAARIVQLDAGVRVAHALEDCLVAAQQGRVKLTATHIDVLLQGVDLLTRLGQVAEADLATWQAEQADSIGALVEALAAITMGRPSAVAGQPGPQAPAPPHLAARPPDAGHRTPDAAPAAKPAPHERDTTDRVVRVTAENLDRLMGLAGESMVEIRWLRPFAQSLLQLKKSQRELSQFLEKLRSFLDSEEADAQNRSYILQARRKAEEFRQILTDRFNEFEQFARRSSNLSNRLYREVIASRMRPFADGTTGFPRLVRDLARQLGKNVRLEILGKTTDVDRDILEKLEAPLNHMLRNSIDHGIEMPDERLGLGKSAEGTIRLEARHRAGMLVISLTDDGRGVDLERLRAKIIARNLASAEIAAKLSETELLDFLFLPGFSTAAAVTEISGRGVGLDVVQNMIQEVGGTVRTATRPGQGMSFYLQLPLTLSVIRTLLVEISREPYALPLARLERVLVLPRAAVKSLEGRPYFASEGENIGLISAHQVLKLEETHPDPAELAVVVIGDRFSRYGVVVDDFRGERDLVVRPLDRRLGKVPDISAAAVLGDGSPVLILDVDDLVRSVEKLLAGGQLRRIGREGERSDRRRKRILVVDDSLTVREVERKLLENRGYEVETAVDGMDGWNCVRTGQFDLVITDVDMPRVNGIELVTMIKRDPALKSLPVTIVSYRDREEERVRGLQAGANYYLTKSSFQDDTFLSAVLDLIGEATT